MPSNKTQKISFAQLGDFLQTQWEAGNIDSDIHDYIEAGLLPIHLLREKLRLLIERSDEDGYLDVTEL